MGKDSIQAYVSPSMNVRGCRGGAVAMLRYPVHTEISGGSVGSNKIVGIISKPVTVGGDLLHSVAGGKVRKTQKGKGISHEHLLHDIVFKSPVKKGESGKRDNIKFVF